MYIYGTSFSDGTFVYIKPPDPKKLTSSPLGHPFDVFKLNSNLETCGASPDKSSINWGWLEHSGTINLSVQLTVNIDYMLDIYEMYSDYIQDRFAIEEQAEHIAKLNELFARRIEIMANEYAESVGSFLEKYGTSGEKDVLKESVLALSAESMSARFGISFTDLGISAASDNKSGNLYPKNRS